MNKLLLLVPLLLIPACAESHGSDANQKPAGSGTPLPADEQPMDRIITERVQLALQQERPLELDLPNVQVSAREGVVTLSGRVSTPEIKDRFGIVTSAVGSVVRVDNKLSIGDG